MTSPLRIFLDANPTTSIAETINELVHVIHSAQRQTELMESPNGPHGWMLDYVYDSKLRNALDAEIDAFTSEDFSPFQG